MSFWPFNLGEIEAEKERDLREERVGERVIRGMGDKGYG